MIDLDKLGELLGDTNLSLERIAAGVEELTKLAREGALRGGGGGGGRPTQWVGWYHVRPDPNAKDAEGKPLFNKDSTIGMVVGGYQWVEQYAKLDLFCVFDAQGNEPSQGAGAKVIGISSKSKSGKKILESLSVNRDGKGYHFSKLKKLTLGIGTDQADPTQQFWYARPPLEDLGAVDYRTLEYKD